MLFDELKVYVPQDGHWGLEPEEGGKLVEEETCYLKSEVDAAIAELKAEIKRKETVGQMWFERCMEARTENVGLERAIWLARAERYKMKEFIAREEGNLSNQMSWSRVLRERTYNQWVDQLLRIANLANKLQNKCRAKAEKFKEADK